MKKITIMAALVVAAATSYGAISINWDTYGFKSYKDETKYATQSGQGVKLVWDLVYTSGSEAAAVTYDKDTGTISYGSDTVLSRRTATQGNTTMTVENLFASDVAAKNLTWYDDYGTATGTKTYKNFQDETMTSGGIYAAVFQFMADGSVYYDVTAVNTSINWAATKTGGSDKVTFGDGKSTYQISKVLYEKQTIPEPATMSLLGLGALAMVIRRKLRK